MSTAVEESTSWTRIPRRPRCYAMNDHQSTRFAPTMHNNSKVLNTLSYSWKICHIWVICKAWADRSNQVLITFCIVTCLNSLIIYIMLAVYKLMRSEFQGLYCVFNWDLLRMFLLCVVIGSNVCRANNGGCSSLCLLTPTGRSCACADDQILDTDNKTCKGGVCCALSGLTYKSYYK